MSFAAAAAASAPLPHPKGTPRMREEIELVALPITPIERDPIQPC
jgi:hypothetical protein